MATTASFLLEVESSKGFSAPAKDWLELELIESVDHSSVELPDNGQVYCHPQ